jgi:hypothetical protein
MTPFGTPAELLTGLRLLTAAGVYTIGARRHPERTLRSRVPEPDDQRRR